MTLDDAIATFAQGVARTRSVAFPSRAEQLAEAIWVVRDDPPVRARARSEEYIGCGVSAAELDETARRNAQGRRRLCAIAREESLETALRADFRALGCRLVTTEPLMTHDLVRIACAVEPLPVVRIATAGQAAALGKSKRRKPLPLQLLQGDSPLMRQYAAFDGDAAIGWVGTVAVNGNAWVSELFVAAQYRRRGIARALLSRMLRDNRADGAKNSVLLASHAGAKLYPTVGYTQLGTLLVYTPRKLAVSD